jgi:hypothetical protein
MLIALTLAGQWLRAEGTGSFTGVVLLDGSQPLAGARVGYNNVPELVPLPGGGYKYAEPFVSGSVISGQDGRFTVTDTPAGKYVFCASGTQPTHLRTCQWQYGLFPLNFEVTANTITNLGSVNIRTGAMVTFAVNDSAGIM